MDCDHLVKLCQTWLDIFNRPHAGVKTDREAAMFEVRLLETSIGVNFCLRIGLFSSFLQCGRFVFCTESDLQTVRGTSNSRPYVPLGVSRRRSVPRSKPKKLAEYLKKKSMESAKCTLGIKSAGQWICPGMSTAGWSGPLPFGLPSAAPTPHN